jgi:hypothetical protein
MKRPPGAPPPGRLYMTRNAGLRISAVFLLLLLPLTSPLRAADRGPAPKPAGLAAWVWTALVDLQKELFGDSHGTMDPDGLNGSDSRGTMDPDGLH